MNDDTKNAVGEFVKETVEAAEETAKKPGMRKVARFGFYSKGFLFIVIGTLALMLLFGFRRGSFADATGALAALAEGTLGKILLVIFAAGGLAHGFWNILRGAADIDECGRGWQGIIKRIVSIGVGIFYVSLGVSAIEILIAAQVHVGNSQAEETFITILAALPIIGTVISASIGLGLIGGGVSECYSGISGKYQQTYRLWELQGFKRILVSALGVLSFSARALLLVFMGYYFLRGAAFGKEGQVGMDAALLDLLSASYGPWVVLAVAFGLIANGVLAFFEAHYRRLGKI